MASPRRFALLFAFALLSVACGGGTPKTTPTPGANETSQPTSVVTPQPTAPSVRIPNIAPATEITLPPGFTAYKLAGEFTRATSIALAPNGDVYISQRGGNLYHMIDADDDGVFESRAVYADGFDELTGLLFAADGTLYASDRGNVTILRDTDANGVADGRTVIISGLPVGRHQNDGLAFGPDGKLYVTLGSTCDDCVERDPRSASILQANADGTGLHVYAKGLRNPYDLVWDSEGRLWATDNGSDDPCATIDELNLIVDGGDYGWPYAAGGGGCNPLTDATPPAADLGLHTASTGIDVYKGAQFPAEYEGNLFMTLWGSLVSAPQKFDRDLLRGVINTPPSGTPNPPASVEVTSFARGFAHPIDVVVDRDGTLLVLDYGDEDNGGGALYRIVYTGR
jgi:glucose/arabinose dehydrogenase